jgi:hypothetical protein
MDAENSSWLAIYVKDGELQAWPCESRIEAETYMKTAAVMGSCWGVASFEVQAKRLYWMDEGRAIREIPVYEWLTERGYL